jgi:L-threonylcarbamoyladenylate synthase
VTSELEQAAATLKAGGVVLHATEGVWGLACDPWQGHAVAKVLALKNRAADKGLIVIGATDKVFRQQLDRVSAEHRRAVQASWPGAHTWVLPDDSLPGVIRGHRDTLACRVPGHSQARALCELFGGMLVSTSANSAGQPAITCGVEAEQAFASRVDYVLPGEVGTAGAASVIHGLDGKILR